MTPALPVRLSGSVPDSSTAGLSHADPRDKQRLGAPSHAEDRALSGPSALHLSQLAESCRAGRGAWACRPLLPSQVGWGAG